MPQTLLLADDSVTIQRVIELTFAEEDINVLAVSDGDQAIDRIEAHPPDIVLVDVGMPGRSGYDVARHIKASPRLQHIPVLLLTGAFEPVDEATAASVGCDGVLAKPFEPQLVISRVKDLLGRPATEDSRNGDAAMAAAAVSDPVPAAPASRASDVWGEPPAPTADAARPPQVARLDSYFAKLDEAFSALGGNGAPQAKAAAADPAPVADMIDWFGATPGTSSTGSTGAGSKTMPDLPPAVMMDADPDLAVPAGAFESTPEEKSPVTRYEVPLFPPAPEVPAAAISTFTTPASPTPTPASMAISAAPPLVAATELATLPDAFSAILAAEQHEPMSAVAPTWPAPSPVSAAGPAVGVDAAITDEVIETITRRVLERLSDRVVRETVADHVSAVAERLVRDEIDRIKASLR